ncbi:hypothetical protein BaRGS_00009036 [Batillaria attramentaria]|uniref:Uncharacterized protein n=1 Tax=Batillaria attramentaria TaxID=370345 RepID=A0ABD0LJX0_9CAEN
MNVTCAWAELCGSGCRSPLVFRPSCLAEHEKPGRVKYWKRNMAHPEVHTTPSQASPLSEQGRGKVLLRLGRENAGGVPAACLSLAHSNASRRVRVLHGG